MKKVTKQYIADFLIVMLVLALVYVAAYKYVFAQDTPPPPVEGFSHDTPPPIPGVSTADRVAILKPAEVNAWARKFEDYTITHIVPIRMDNKFTRQSHGHFDRTTVTRVLVVARIVR